eukprot:763385-Hanusia_phi.AAC.1
MASTLPAFLYSPQFQSPSSHSHSPLLPTSHSLPAGLQRGGRGRRLLVLQQPHDLSQAKQIANEGQDV